MIFAIFLQLFLFSSLLFAAPGNRQTEEDQDLDLEVTINDSYSYSPLMPNQLLQLSVKGPEKYLRHFEPIGLSLKDGSKRDWVPLKSHFKEVHADYGFRVYQSKLNIYRPKEHVEKLQFYYSVGRDTFHVNLPFFDIQFDVPAAQASTSRPKEEKVKGCAYCYGIAGANCLECSRGMNADKKAFYSNPENLDFKPKMLKQDKLIDFEEEKKADKDPFQYDLLN